MIDAKQELIYNIFLRTSRQVKNQPFKSRKNFDTLTPTQELILKKLARFFECYPHINYEDFFIAPYKIYNKRDKNEYFGIDFFITPRAIKSYSQYKKESETNDPDNDDTIQQCKECCKFVYSFCKENNLTLTDYKSISSNVPLAIQHLKEHKINLYTLHGLDIKNLFNAEDTQVYNFLIDDLVQQYNDTKVKFLHSKKLKHTIRTALKIIEEKLLKNQK